MTVLDAPDRDLVLGAALRLLARDGAVEKLSALPIASTASTSEGWTWVPLPDWASDLVPAGKPGLFVPASAGSGDWRGIAWWHAASQLLSSATERAIEGHKGPAHSYAFRLNESIAPAFDHAWVNRIVLFLRRWWAVEYNQPEVAAFGPVPQAVVHLTHDVDAISKTLAIRAKQTAFCLYNRRPAAAARFLLGPADYWQFDRILKLEDAAGRRSLWNLYGGRGGWLRSPKEILMDPAYRVSTPRLRSQLVNMVGDGHRIGLHPRFATWRDAEDLQVEKSTIEEAIGQPVTQVRQHWLRFSFNETWAAQRAAGLDHDLTLGFNDRPGFRNSAALSFTDPGSGMRVTPMVLMDSHLYDYATLDEEDRFSIIDALLDELVATGGEASVIWHQRVFHADYDWGGGYAYLLDGLRKRQILDPYGSSA